jgi:hypothetical protein
MPNGWNNVLGMPLSSDYEMESRARAKSSQLLCGPQIRQNNIQMSQSPFRRTKLLRKRIFLSTLKIWLHTTAQTTEEKLEKRFCVNFCSCEF